MWITSVALTDPESSWLWFKAIVWPAAWAVLNYIGDDGYLEMYRQKLACMKALVAGLRECFAVGRSLRFDAVDQALQRRGQARAIESPAVGVVHDETGQGQENQDARVELPDPRPRRLARV